MTAALLEVRGLTRVFGGIKAVDSMSFDAPEGGITGLIGPNGAGKTTVFNLIPACIDPLRGRYVSRARVWSDACRTTSYVPGWRGLFRI